MGFWFYFRQMGRRAAVVAGRTTLAVLLLFGADLFCAQTSEAAQQKRFGGVGLQVVPIETGELVVLRVVPGTSAQAAGMKPGDLILKVDDFLLRGSVFDEVVTRYLWGEAGTRVTLEFQRPGTEGRRRATLERSPIDPDTTAPPGVRMIRPDGK